MSTMKSISMISLYYANKHLTNSVLRCLLLVMIVNTCSFISSITMIMCHQCRISTDIAPFHNTLFGGTYRTPTHLMSMFMFLWLVTLLCMIVQFYGNVVLFVSTRIECMFSKYNCKYLMLSMVSSIAFVIASISRHWYKISLINTKNTNKNKESKRLNFIPWSQFKFVSFIF